MPQSFHSPLNPVTESSSDNSREKVLKSLNLFAARAYLDGFAPVPRQRHHSDKTIAAE
jgi:hypothetical protein